MGAFAPTFLAFFQNLYGVYLFEDTKSPGCEPLVSCLIFLLAVFLLLWDVQLYPRTLRRQARYINFFLEYLLNAFLIEHIMNDFWFPLENSLVSFLPFLADLETEKKTQGFLSFLRSGTSAVVASYLLSIFFLIAILHSTRIIDLRLFQDGTAIFFDDLRGRSKKSLKRLPRFFSFTKKRVKFKKLSRSCSKTRSRSKKPKPRFDTILKEYLSCTDDTD